MPRNSQPQETAPSNTRLWDVLGKTDPKHTRPFSRGGGFKGTAVKPMWQNLQLTELFGPCGIGWGFEKPEFTIQQGHGAELLVYCVVAGWYIDPDTKETGHVFGVGGDKVIAQFSSKVANDDEAFKKAFTDAIGNAFKFVGIAADVHMGLFDDSKYVQDTAREFESQADVLGTRIDDMTAKLREAGNLDGVTKLYNEVALLRDDLIKDKREEEAAMIVSTYKATRARHAPKPKPVAKDPPADDSAAVAERDQVNADTGN